MQIRMEEVCRRGVERIPEGAMTEPDIFLFEEWGLQSAHGFAGAMERRMVDGREFLRKDFTDQKREVMVTVF